MDVSLKFNKDFEKSLSALMDEYGEVLTVNGVNALKVSKNYAKLTKEQIKAAQQFKKLNKSKTAKKAGVKKIKSLPKDAIRAVIALVSIPR